MHLKQLKLSGFKSFVDPTVVPFSSQLVAVVGPNGCGKSNIIDAVRWVMGEASAKTLRGESMTDVIFNGSSNRKPVGLASVELVFDNSLGRLSGEYASYQEISIKRVVTRDGDSGYFLNGGRCRRRDITDLFLGTGAGTRGYSIIGQNTISQFVEAKPEELRAYFEEAAGVSKYKDRRRETLQRIEKTRENLARVDDICNELASQLQRLERQAKVAERYKILKTEERRCKGDILVVKYRHLIHEQEQTHAEINRLSCVYEEHQANVAHALKSQVMIEEQLSLAQESFQTIQSQYYQIGNEVARLQEIQQQRIREKQQVIADQNQVKADMLDVDRQLQSDNEASSLAEQTLNQLQERLETLKRALEDATHALQCQQKHENQWNQTKQETQSHVNQFQRESQVAELHFQHSQQREREATLRLEKIQMERQGLVDAEGQAALNDLREQDAHARDAHKTANEHYQQLLEQGSLLKDELRNIEQQLRVEQDSLQTLTTKHAAMTAAQQAALHDVQLTTELAAYSSCPRLVELINIEEQWRAVCEWVLGESLHAVTLDDFDLLWPDLAELKGQAAVFVKQTTSALTQCSVTRLIDKIEGFKPSWVYSLEHVMTADSLEEAMCLQKTLAAHESVITSNGFWLGVGWLRIANFEGADETSFLVRKKAIAELQAALDSASSQVALLRTNRDTQHEKCSANENEQRASKTAVSECHHISIDISAKFQQKQHALQQASLRLQTFNEEQEELTEHLETLALERVRFEDAFKKATQQRQVHDEQLQQIMSEKTELDALTLSCRSHATEAQAVLHQTELEFSREQLKVQQLRDTIAREQLRLDTLNERLLALNQRYHNFDTSDTIPSDLLKNTIEQHQQLDAVLNQTRQQVEELQITLKNIQQSKLVAEQQASARQDDLLKQQLAEQASAVRMSTLLESLTELESEVNLQTRLSLMLETITLDELSSQLVNIENNIKRLGAINLVAIEEYQSELARKTHLDTQASDLKDAIAMLETAIAKMDKETQSRLKDTFDSVNTLFQTLFPRLFGGGQARLQLTCDNLLEAGVVVMAQPPGKRNSTIHLLSGGEKAMTAVALVFAIFQLNPSPFCMLDEVDAPLDDLNVGRFCDLVKEMSPYVQFLLISHNKVTMELAEHLIGVTMREPGVSRIVAVDVEQALSLTEPAE